MDIKSYKTKAELIKGIDYKTVYKQALFTYKNLSSKTKRKPYIRSKYFNKEKIFLDYFWQHIHEKSMNDKTRRLKYYDCAIDLIINTNLVPSTKQNPNKLSEKLHRFKGTTESNSNFFVQIVEKKNGQKHFISAFPE